MKMTILSVLAGVVLLLSSGSNADAGRLKGKVQIDGSSTVFPITEAIAEEYGAVEPRVRVTVGVSGTGGGFKKFLAGETDLNDASRPIKAKEIAKAAEAGIGFIEMPVAFDGITVVINPANDFVDHLTVEELHAIWGPDSSVKTWADVRPSWPAREIHLYGPGTDSGTFDYFTEAINGKSQACRADFTASEDDNVLVQGVAGDVDALGFFGYAYYVENKERLTVVSIDGGNGPVSPSLTSISDGSYTPLARPIFVYVREEAASRPEVQSFMHFYLKSAAALVAVFGYVALPADVYELALARFDQRVTGSVFAGRENTVGMSLLELFSIQ
jgi:phosphate transport system substrate-binding protein